MAARARWLWLGVGLVAVAMAFVAPTLAARAIPHCTPGVVDYPIVYVRAPRFGDEANTHWPEVQTALLPDPGADLRLLRPDCTEQLLFPLPHHQTIVDAPIGSGAVSDPNVSFDGQWVVFAYYHDQRDGNPQRCGGEICLARKGADIYRLHLATGETARLTRQEFTPNTGNGADFAGCGGANEGNNCPRVGVFNVGPAWVAQEDASRPAIVFTSSRNNFLPPTAFSLGQRTLQLFTMDWDGRNVQQIGFLNNMQALHPTQLADGRLMYTSWESQGIRDPRQFNLWTIAPDGTQWNSLSGFGENAISHHFMTQMADGDIVVARYYNANNNGFGDLIRFPLDPPGPDFGAVDDPAAYMPFQRVGQVYLTAWSDTPYYLAQDFPAPCAVGGAMYPPVPCAGGNDARTGKVTQPAAAPEGDLLLTYTRGAANHNGIYIGEGLATPFYDGGLVRMDAPLAETGSTDPAQLDEILNDPAWSEQWPRPVVPFAALFPGRVQPDVWPELRNAGSAHLPPNSPLALIGAASLTHRGTAPRAVGTDDPDPFNASHDFLAAWRHQGADAGLYEDDDIYAIRLLALLPATDRLYPDNGRQFYNVGTERLRILGEVPVRHADAPDDTSFLARIPADTPFTFQTLDRNGMVLNMAQTWHQLRPGEVRYDCGGCHAHAQEPLDFYETVAGQPDYQPTDAALQTTLLQLSELGGDPATVALPETQVTIEYFRDVQPILAERCAGCHGDDTGDGRLNLHDDATPIRCGTQTWPGTYYRLAIDNAGGAAGGDNCPAFGLGTPPDTPDYFQLPQLTRYLRAFQARESLLVWKLFGARLDGRTNATRGGDLDFTPDALHAGLLFWDEKLTLARWVDLGAPLDFGTAGSEAIQNPNSQIPNPPWGWFEDDLRPTLWAAPTLAAACAGPTSHVSVGAYDLESGLAAGSLQVTFNVPIGGQPTGTNFAVGLSLVNGGTLDIPLPAPVTLGEGMEMRVRIRDGAGHMTEIVRAFGACAGAPPAQTERLYLPAIVRHEARGEIDTVGEVRMKAVLKAHKP